MAIDKLASLDLAVAGFYRFVPLQNPAALCAELRRVLAPVGIKGTILLAKEGVNGTIAGPDDAVREVIDGLRCLKGLEAMPVRRSRASHWPFRRLKVKLRKEIVTLKNSDVNPHELTGDYVAARDWDVFLANSNVVLIDARNDYEVAIGGFRGAIDPKIKSFSEFPDWWKARAHEFEGKTVAMYCTGGIRCEKASNYLRRQGVERVAQLQGGVLAYLEEVPRESTSWSGECFVFDDRVSLTHGLKEGTYRMCQPCGSPVRAGEVHCPNCGATMTAPGDTSGRSRPVQA